MPILHLTHELASCAEPHTPSGVTITTFHENPATAAWLALREHAFSGLSPPVGSWDENDFRREFQAQPWWRPDQMWLAYCKNTPEIGHLAGTVCLAVRNGPAGCIASSHWLAVGKSFRSRGIGRLLMNILENAAYAAGHRRVVVETHSRWTEALAFYKKLGYR